MTEFLVLLLPDCRKTFSAALIWRWYVPTDDQVSSYIDGALYGTGEIQRNDVLCIDIPCQGFRISWALFCHPGQAAAQRFEFLFDYLSIHARLRSASIRLR